MKISYAITVCNELKEIQKLVPFLKENKRPQDEIVILFDQKNGNEEVADYLKQFNKLPNIQFWRGMGFENNFADWKNTLAEYCSGDYIFQIDADEMVTPFLINVLPDILELNDIDLYYIPRINTVEGLTPEHVQKWKWRVDDKQRINFPDYQGRIYKNSPNIKWEGKVHERISGTLTHTKLPTSDHFCLIHEKNIDRQEKQNELYSKL